MANTPSTMLPLGTEAPDFSLPDPSGRLVSLADFEAKKALVVMFLSNHCPFVKHVADELAQMARDYEAKGVGFVAINANDVEKYPADAPPKMVEEAKLRGYIFPYLYDESQQIAKAYRAACTPDFYVFGKQEGTWLLTYRGQLDSSRPGNQIPVTGSDLRKAIDRTLAAEPIPEADQRPSIGCNIKWKAGNAPDYFG